MRILNYFKLNHVSVKQVRKLPPPKDPPNGTVLCPHLVGNVILSPTEFNYCCVL